MFASDEEALAAAEDAYGRYNQVTNAVGQSGWIETEDLRDVARGDALVEEIESARASAAKGWRQVGSIGFDSLTLQQYVVDGPKVSITVYLCVDVSTVDVIDSSGASVVSASRPDRQPIEVEIDNHEQDLKIVRSDGWSGQNFC